MHKVSILDIRQAVDGSRDPKVGGLFSRDWTGFISGREKQKKHSGGLGIVICFFAFTGFCLFIVLGYRGRE